MGLFGSTVCWMPHDPSVLYRIVQVHIPRLVLRAPIPVPWPALPTVLALHGRSWGGRWAIGGQLVATQGGFGVVHLVGDPRWQDTRHTPRYPLVIPCRMDSQAGSVWGMTQDCSYQSLAWGVSADVITPALGEPVRWTLRHVAQEFTGQGVCVRKQSLTGMTIVAVRIQDAASTQQLAQILALQGWGEA